MKKYDNMKRLGSQYNWNSLVSKNTSGAETKLRVCERRTGVRTLRLQALFEREKRVEVVGDLGGRVVGVVETLGNAQVGVDDLRQGRDVRTTSREGRLPC